MIRIEIIPDRRDELDLSESTLTKTRAKTKDTSATPSALPSALSEARRLEIIEEILKKLSETNVIDEIRRANAVPYQLPRYNNPSSSFSFPCYLLSEILKCKRMLPIVLKI